jgi:hypothetical protein
MSNYGDYSYRSTGDWVIQSAKRNPEAFLVLAAGCALLLRTGRNGWAGMHRPEPYDEDDFAPSYGEKSRRTTARRKGRVSEAMGSASETISSATGQVRDTVGSYASTVSGYARSTGRRASRLTGQARTTAGDVLREQPWTVALLGLGAGAAVASLLPSISAEEKALAPARDALADAAGRAVHKVREAAAETATRVQHEATMRAATGLKDIARDAAKTFTGSMSGETEGQQGGDGSREGSQ